MKNTLKICIVLIILINLVMLYYKFYSNEYMILDINNVYKNIEVDLDKYQDSIVVNYPDKVYNTYTIDIHAINNKFYNELYMENNNLYIKDSNDSKERELITNVEHLMYSKSDDVIFIYVLTNNNDIYTFNIDGTKSNEIEIKKVNNKIRVKNFTKFIVNSYLDKEISDFIVIGTDDKLYYMPNEILYEPEMLDVENKYIVYKDSTLAKYTGEMLVDKNNIEFKIKNIFIVKNSDIDLIGKPDVVFINTNNNIMYVHNDKIYIYNKKIKNIKNVNDKLEIIFKDNTHMNCEIETDNRYYAF